MALLIGLCLLGGILGRLQTGARNEGRIDPISNVAQRLVIPTADAIRTLDQNIQDFGQGVTNARHLTAENRALREQLAALNLYSEREAGLARALRSAEALAGIAPIGTQPPVSARITGYFPHESRITLNVGSRQSIQPGMAVLASGGLLAVVGTVNDTDCQAQLTTSPQVRVGVSVLGTPIRAGIAKGDGGRLLEVEFIGADRPFQVGDRVVTSGYSERIPGGIPVGEVIQVIEEPDFGSRRLRLAPFSDIDRTVGVKVIR